MQQDRRHETLSPTAEGSGEALLLHSKTIKPRLRQPNTKPANQLTLPPVHTVRRMVAALGRQTIFPPTYNILLASGSTAAIIYESTGKKVVC